MANAHAWRHRNGRGAPCTADCFYCKSRSVRNTNGHRINPTRKKGGKHHPELSYHGDPGRSVLMMGWREVLQKLGLL
jgi:hypothetical protein